MTLAPPCFSDFCQRTTWQDILCAEEQYAPLLNCCVREDLNPSGSKPVWQNDLTSHSCGIQGRGEARLITRQPLTLCGIRMPEILSSFFSCDEVQFHQHYEDGDLCNSGDVIGSIEGSVPQILAIERTLLNFIQRLSGVATKTSEFVRILDQEGVALLDTRKTTPGLRLFEKYATACGGSFNHRVGLFDRVLIKDNHLAAAGIKDSRSLTEFLKKIKDHSQGKLIEVEIDEITQLKAVLEAKVDAVLLDNFSPQEVTQAVNLSQNRVVLEASGGINLANLLDYALARPHFISTGFPVHGARWVDIGMDWIE